MVAKHYEDNEKHKLRFTINRFKIDWFKKFQTEKSIKDSKGKQIENLKWTLHKINPNAARRQNLRIMTVKLFVPYNKVEGILKNL